MGGRACGMYHLRICEKQRNPSCWERSHFTVDYMLFGVDEAWRGWGLVALPRLPECCWLGGKYWHGDRDLWAAEDASRHRVHRLHWLVWSLIAQEMARTVTCCIEHVLHESDFWTAVQDSHTALACLAVARCLANR